MRRVEILPIVRAFVVISPVSIAVRNAVRIAALLAALIAAVLAPDLPALVRFSTPAGRFVAVATLAVLASTIAAGIAAGIRHRKKLRPIADLLRRHRVAAGGGALLWILASHHVPAGASRTEIYRLVASLAAPLAGAVATMAAASMIVPRAGARAGGLAPARSPRGIHLSASLLIALAAVFAAGAAIFLARIAFGGAPHIQDEIAYLFDARVFAAGRRFAAAPPVPAAFPAPDWIEVEADRAYGVFPPGWPRFLALGVRAGIPGLVNPIAAALVVLVTAGLAALAVPGEASRPRSRSSAALPATAWLVATSPFLLVLAASFMAHTAATLWTAGALLFYAMRTGPAGGDAGPGQRPSLAPALGLALAAALLLVTRPIEAAALLAATIADALHARRGIARAFPWLALGLALGGILLLADQAAVTGSPRVPPVERYFERHFAPASNRLGFGPDVGLAWDGGAPGHSPGEALSNLGRNLEALNRHLGGWPAGSFFLLFAFLCGAPKTRLERLLLFHAGFLVALYALYWYHGLALGPRFLAALTPALTIFTWHGAAGAGGWLEREWPGRSWEARMRAALLLSVACALAFYLPVKVVSEYRGLRGVDPRLLAQVEAAPAPALVFIRGPRWPDFATAYFLNAPDFSGPRVVALSRSPALDREVAAVYPERKACIAERGAAVRGLVDDAGPEAAGVVPPGRRARAALSLK